MDKSLLDDIIQIEEKLRREIDGEKTRMREILDTQQCALENRYNQHVSRLEKRSKNVVRKRIELLTIKQMEIAKATELKHAKIRSLEDSTILLNLTELLRERLLKQTHDHQDVKN